MKKLKNKNTIIILTCIVITIALIVGTILLLTRDKTPQPVKVDVKEINGYTEVKDQKFISLPKKLTVEFDGSNTDLIDIVSVGKYTGEYIDGESVYQVKDALAFVVANNTTSHLSIASVTVKYDKDKFCKLSPTNIPPASSALILPDVQSVAYSDVKSLECTVDFGIPQDEVPMITDKVKLDFKDGKFTVTNLTGDDLGDVYIRFKRTINDDVFFGSKTFSVMATDLKANTAQYVDAADYNEKNCKIIAVENVS